MAAVTLDSHDVLGKLSIIKNYLSVIRASVSSGEQASLEYLDRVIVTNEELITTVKEKSLNPS
ncbi:hypothetical protein A3B56_02095 [Candidatus Roizmanbacteria bacterium RIFCSPLOWO2_01_FULL_45_11]|uniref:Uncharacterized protein n=1 Tax=Candidatus Roizmanbacteria bacterium RIFCSPLOWO2_01_FULL_45_11 TaxID=1802070 RepID=A0A1F7JE85_9BACT|nr:MAG: hypothetical protein A3B56_02095 [Candidatus Roizmanbacteria bacterium RIFCSPLOWO2_01_FULL_45_11]